MKKTSESWSSKPGNWDTTHTYRRRFPSCNRYGFPELEPAQFEIDDANRAWMSYKERDDSGQRQAEAVCHFFLDDYRFESVWTRPDAALNRIQRFWAAMTPDWSLFVDWPPAVQIWNTYRNRWTGRYWQQHGVMVIPTVNWSDRDSWQWCFLGLPKDSIVAVATPDIRRIDNLRKFRQGFRVMVDRLDPRLILVYGRLPFACDCPYIERAPDWTRLRCFAPQLGADRRGLATSLATGQPGALDAPFA